MDRRRVDLIFGVLVFTLLVGVFGAVLNVPVVEGDGGAIYIRADGSIDPSTSSISTMDNSTYVLNGNVTSDFDGIVVERDNIVVDGAGYTLQGSGNGTGIELSGRSNVTNKNTEITTFYYGIWLSSSSDSNSISGNDITENNCGIWLSGSSNNSIWINNVTANNGGIELLFSCSNNSMWGNNIANSSEGIYLGYSSNNNIQGNNVTANNGHGIYLFGSDNSNVSGNIAANNGIGIMFAMSSSNSVLGNDVVNNDFGISLGSSSNNTVSANNLTENSHNGIEIDNSSNNTVLSNKVTNNFIGIYIYGSSNNNTVTDNNITANYNYGIHLIETCSNNSIYHNNFINNTSQVSSDFSTNVWDDGYPSGGNYWSDYNGTDVFSGPHQNETGSDGIADVPYVIDASNQDNYPLMNPWVPYENGTVYICDDGSVDPSGAPILRKGDLYTLADNVISDGDGIVVERDNIVLDGAGYIVQGAGTSNGVDLSGRSNVTVKNAAISNFHYGIYFTDGNNATLSGVEVRVCDYGIWFYSASNSSILSNTVTGCAWMGITVARAPIADQGREVIA